MGTSKLGPPEISTPRMSVQPLSGLMVKDQRVKNRQSGNPKPVGLPNNPQGSRYLPGALLEKIASSSIGSPTLKRLEPLVERNWTCKSEGPFRRGFCTVGKHAKSAAANRCWTNLNCIVPCQIPRSCHGLSKSW